MLYSHRNGEIFSSDLFGLRFPYTRISILVDQSAYIEGLAHGHDEVLQLVSSAQAGDREAFAELYHLYVRDVMRYIASKAPADWVEDIVSEVFFRAWKKRKSFSGNEGKKFKSWLFSIAHNLMVDVYRKNKETLPLDTALFVPEDSNSPKEVAEKELALDSIAEAMSSLSDTYREVVTLRYFNEFSHKEIAEVMGTSEGNVRILLHRAVKKIKEFVASATN